VKKEKQDLRRKTGCRKEGKVQRGRQGASRKVSNKNRKTGCRKVYIVQEGRWCRKNEVQEGRQVQKETEGAGR
jgi:hypothetical protein